MAFKPGKDSYFALDNAAGSLTNLSPYIDNVSAPQSIEQLDVSTIGTAAKAFIAGQTDGDTITLGGPLDATLHTHLSALKAAQAAGTASFTFNYGPMGSVSGYPQITAECLLASYQPSAAVSGRAEWTASLQVTGAVTSSTY